MTDEKYCSICGGDIQSPGSTNKYGNNAEPVNHGRCCDMCDEQIVIPHRIRLIIRHKHNKNKVEDKQRNP